MKKKKEKTARRAGSGKQLSPSIVAYELVRFVEPWEIPKDVAVKPSLVRGVLGRFPVGLDVRELALFTRPGRYQLVPIDADRGPQWEGVVDLLMTERDAEQQRSIRDAILNAVLDRLPYDREGLLTAIREDADAGECHGVFQTIQEELIRVWTERSQKGCEPTEHERAAVRKEVASRIVQGMREMAPPVQMNQESLLELSKNSIGCSWDRIECALAAGEVDDAVLRALLRPHFKMRFPVERLWSVLVHVPRLDMMFLILRHLGDEIVAFIAELDVAAGERVVEPEVMILALYVAQQHVQPSTFSALVCRMLPRLARDIETMGPLCCRLLEWLAQQVGDTATVRAVATRDDLGDRDTLLAIARKEYARTIGEIASSLPKRGVAHTRAAYRRHAAAFRRPVVRRRTR